MQRDLNLISGCDFLFLSLDLISGIKYVYLLTDNILLNVGVLRTLFRSLEIRIYPYNGVNGAEMMQPLNKTLCVFISPILKDE